MLIQQPLIQIDSSCNIAEYFVHIRDANSHLLHSKWVSLFVVQVFLQVEEGIEEYVGHPAALQITKGYLTWRKRHIHRRMHE